MTIEKDADAIDWLALTDQESPNENGDETTEGCLIDTTGVGVNRIIENPEEGAAIVDFVEGEIKIHSAGFNSGGERGGDSIRFSDEAEMQERNWIAAIRRQPTFVKVLLMLVPIAIVGGIGVVLFSVLRSAVQTTARRFTCRIPAVLQVEDKSIAGRIIRLGPASCQFVPDIHEDSEIISRALLLFDVPDFDLTVGPKTFPIIPDNPGSRFISIHFVKPLIGAVLDVMKERSETPTRKEQKRPKIVNSPQREQLRASRLRRMMIIENTSAAA